MKKILAVLLVFIVLLCNPIAIMSAEAPSENELFAKSAVLIDADSGRILYAKNADCEMANASTTKILTCIIVLENCDLNGIVTVSNYASSQPRVRLGMREGQQFYAKDLLYGLMLESFNDCAVALAEYVAGTVEGFAGMMNDKATEIGCQNSYFITPNGLDAKDDTGFHHTTANDLAKIMRYCIKQSDKSEDFLTITRTPQYNFADCDNNSNFCCNNHNAFLQMMEGALSGKTGFTGNAGYCYVGALTRDDKTYIVALLACGWPNNKGYKWSDTKKLMQYGLDTFSVKTIHEVEKNENDLNKITIFEAQSAGIQDEVNAVVYIQKNQETDRYLLREEEQIKSEITMEKVLNAPVEKGTVVGMIRYYVGDETLRVDQIIVGKSVKRIDFSWCMNQILNEAKL